MTALYLQCRTSVAPDPPLAGHAGAAGGAGHFRIRITAQAFSGLNSVARHRLVYGALKEFMPHEIHALAIHALAPNES